MTQPNDPNTPLLDLRAALGADMEVEYHHKEWKESTYGEGPSSALGNICFQLQVEIEVFS